MASGKSSATFRKVVRSNIRLIKERGRKENYLYIVILLRGNWKNHSPGLSQGTSLHIRKSLISFDESDLRVKISQVCPYKIGGGSFWLRFFPKHECGSAQQCEICSGVLGAAAALVLEHGRVAWMVIFVFHSPAFADFLQYPRWRLALAAAQVDALPVGSLTGFLFCGLAMDLGDRPDAGEVHLQWRDRDVADASDIDASVT